MGVHLHRPDSSSSQDEGEGHRSIASLRAKFENLAHDVKDGARSRLRSNSNRAARPTHIPPGSNDGEGVFGRELQAASSSTSAIKTPISEPSRGQPSAPIAVPSAASTPAEAASNGSRSPPAVSGLGSRSESKHATPARSVNPSPAPQDFAHALPIAARYATSPTPSSGVRSATSSFDQRSSNIDSDGQNAENGTPHFSVAALRERFGKPGPSSTTSAPSRSRRASIEAFLHPSSARAKSPLRKRNDDTHDEGMTPAASSSKDGASQQAPVAATSTSTPSSPPPAMTPSISDTPVEASEPTDRTLTVDPPTMSRPPGSSASTSSSVTTASRKKGPAPPPPAPRSASPAVADNRALLSASPNPLSRPISPVHRPAPPPPKRDSGLQEPESQKPSASVKPPLPVRKATLPGAAEPNAPPERPPPLPGKQVQAPPAVASSSSESSLSAVPPPLPGNKPAAPSAPVSQSLPPAVPSRSRAQTTSRPSTTSTPRPPLPSRQNTVGSAPPAGSRRRSQTIAAEDNFYLPPPPPTRSAESSGTSLKRGTSIAVTGMHSQSHSSDGSGTPHRRNGAPCESDEDDDGEGGAPPLTTMAQRLLDEHPVSTDANRRPPHFTPDVRITSAHSISSFAVWGHYACVAHSHVKVYDTSLGSQILEIDQHKDTGLESRAKEPRITALGFRPAKDKAQEGRYLWCGTKDGHIFEVDIKLGAVTAARSSVHGSAVTHIMRHQGWVITVDESGKVHVWEVLPGEDDDSNYKISRTIRISDKITFAKMIKGRLWTATAPAVRSTTNTAGARGPTIRVYDICARGSAPPPLTALTSEWTGAATSATILPEDPDNIYMGHEGGFVSVWTIDQQVLECAQVLKVSTTDILALEGADKHLWAGNRKGDIHVWNLEEKPWRTSNIWTAHPEQAVQSLTVDPFGIESSGRFIVWSFSRDDLHGWDGLRGVNWIDKRMVERQPDYCDFREVRVLVVSWNIDSAKPTDLYGSPANTSFLEQVLTSIESPDIIVFGFQETIPLTDKRLTAKTLLFGSKGKDGGATSDRVSGAYRAWADKLSQAVMANAQGGASYSKVQSEQLVGLFSCMFVKSSERNSLRDVNITTVKRGIGGIYGNKGAIVARMVIDDTSMCFINVHLAAGQRHKATRNADIAAIMEDKVVFPPADKLPYVHGGDGTGILDHETVVLNGDLNYRIDQRREAVITSITAGDFAPLLEHDQLRREMRGNHAFRLRSFEEAPITFAPTYKFDRGSDEYDSSEKRRIPAWCDRVLYTKTPRIVPISYQSYAVNVSDHKPVSAGLAIEIKRIDPSRMRDVYRETQVAWREHEIKRLKVMVEAYGALY